MSFWRNFEVRHGRFSSLVFLSNSRVQAGCCSFLLDQNSGKQSHRLNYEAPHIRSNRANDMRQVFEARSGQLPSTVRYSCHNLVFALYMGVL